MESQAAPESAPEKKFLPEAGIAYSASSVLSVLLAFLVSAIFLAALKEGYAHNLAYKYLAFLVPQLCLAGVAALYFRRSRYPVRKVYAPCKWYYFLIALAVAFGLLFALNNLNGLFVRLLELMGYTPQEKQPGYIPSVTDPMISGWMILPAVLIIALLPAVFEETLFRGITVGAMRSSGWGEVSTVLISGALFSLFHGNPEQTLYQFACGACYALLALRSGSIFPTMVAHFANNACILILGAVKGVDWALPMLPSIILGVLGGILLVGALLFLILWKLPERRAAAPSGSRMQGGKKYFLMAGIGMAICAVQWFAVLAAGIGV